MKEWFNITELAERTSIPESSIRRYIAKFPDFFMSKGGTRSKRYEDTSIKILIRIKNLFDSGFETEQVDLTLRKEFPMVVDGDEVEEKSATPMIPTVEDVAEIKQALKDQAEFNKALIEELKHLGEKLEQSKVETLRTMMEERKALIEVAAAQQEQKKGWLARLFGK
jgi:DNA-binding transcriptional MerR regulator